LIKNFFIRNRYPLLLFFAFLSGISALVYQIAWIRQFSLFFGAHVLSTSTVLAAFMAGLAIGNYVFGRWSDRGVHPLLLLVIIESGIGLFALLFQPGIKMITGIYGYLANQITGTSDQLPLIKFILSFIFLLIPTILMGGIIPVLSKFLVSNLNRIGNKISWIYALNNLGAATGCLLAGFFLIRLSGMKITILTASIINFFNAIAVGCLFFLLKGQLSENRDNMNEDIGKNISKKQYPVNIIRLVLLVFAIEGFTTLAYEILWNRIFIEFVFEKNTYYYTVIIFSFITGLSAGSYLIRKKVDTIKSQIRFLGILEILIGVTSLLLFVLFITLSPAMVDKREALQSWLEVAGREYVLIFFILIIPASLMGITFPLVSKIYTDQLRHVGKRIGLLGFLDTAGSILGSFIAGFILIGLTGVYYTFLFVVFLNILPGFLLAFYSEKTGKIRIGLPLAATTSLFLIVLLFFPGDQYLQCRFRYYPGEQILEYREGPAASVLASRIPSRHLALAVNGAKTAYTNTEDIRVHTLLAYLPYVLVDNPGETMVIGYGMGVTVNCLSKIAGLKVDVAEISSEVMEVSSSWFTFINDHSADAGNVNMIIDDGRSFLFRSEKKYDIITSNAVHPRLSPNLYTLEFYQLCANRMSEKGIICQWMPTNWMTTNEFGSLVKAFTEIFPYSGLWYISRSHLLLLGSKMPFTYDFMNLSEKLSDHVVMQFLIDCEIYNPVQLVSLLMMTDQELNILFPGVIPDKDDHPIIEYSRETDLAPNGEVLRHIIDHSVYPGNKWKNLGDEGYEEQINHYYAEYIKDLERFLKDFEGFQEAD